MYKTIDLFYEKTVMFREDSHTQDRDTTSSFLLSKSSNRKHASIYTPRNDIGAAGFGVHALYVLSLKNLDGYAHIYCTLQTGWGG
jgi:hypothetical protein